MPDPDDPRLSFRTTIIQAISSNLGSISQFKGSGFDVDRDDLPMIAFFDLLANL
ncbi:MAG: hypothetical protein WCD18_05165 [Thermosynechococcaceae cyanobacterium]